MTGPLVLVVPVYNEAALIGESLPQILHAVHAFPMRGPGKPDRAALAALLAEVAARRARDK